MKTKYSLFISSILGLASCTQSQPSINFGILSSIKNDTLPIYTAHLLQELGWEDLMKFCEQNQGHNAYVEDDSLKITYHYFNNKNFSRLDLVSYDGQVLEYDCATNNTFRESQTYYFDKALWVKYANQKIPDLEEQFHIFPNEPAELLKAYYHLIGLDTRDEYGWICEYGGMGEITDRRLATTVIINHGRLDLLLPLLEFPNIQVQVYAADALIFLDREMKKLIEERTTEAKEEGYDFPDMLTEQLQDRLLTKADWQKIYNLRDSGQQVKTCGNSGSYKIYRVDAAELLSEEAIEEFFDIYQSLENMGYIRGVKQSLILGGN
jgi:hypothetical protein